jgi:hypothetical protein
MTLDPARHGFLRDHRWRGQALLPAAASAVMLFDSAPGLHSLRDFVIHNPLRVNGTPVTVRISASKQDGGVRCVATRQLYHRDGRLLDPRQPFASAIAYEGGARAPEPMPTSASDWQSVPYRDPAQAAADDLVYFGPTMRCLRELSLDPEHPEGRVVAPDDPMFSPPLLDACFVACGIYSLRVKKSAVLVHGVGDLRLGRPAEPGETCRLRYRWTGEEELFHVFDFWLTGVNGDPILEARRCTMVKRGATA